MRKILIIWWILPAACNGDEPKVDENGCWLDAEEAYIAVLEASCDASVHCSPGADSGPTVETCVTNGLDAMEQYRQELCFDGCAMRTCLDRQAEFMESCSDEVDLSYCYEETFHYGIDKACGERPW